MIAIHILPNISRTNHHFERAFIKAITTFFLEGDSSKLKEFIE